MKKQNIIRMFKLASIVTLTLFLAGIVVPSFMYAKYTWSFGSLYTTKIMGITFAYRLQNILAAIFGAAFGCVLAVLVFAVAANKGRRPLAAARSLLGNASSAFRNGLGSRVYSTVVGEFFALFGIEA